MTNTSRETKSAARHIFLGVSTMILSLGLMASVTFAGVPTSQTAGLPLQGTDQPLRRLADSGGNNALPVGPADCTVTGSITNSDPLHYPVLDTDEVPDTCAGANPCPGEFLDETNYDVHTFNNTSGSVQCVTVTVDAAGCQGNPLFSSAYLGNFDPSNLCTNFLGAMDLGTSGTRSYQFNVPANSSFVIVAEPLYGGDTCASYTVSVEGAGITCATGGTPTATSSAIPATPTRTAIGTSTAVATATATPPPATSIATNTPGVPTATPTACTLEFTDVPPTNTFYPFVRCLACQGIISGYPCGSTGEPCNPSNDPYFRPNNPVTRGQLAKIVSESAGFDDQIPPSQWTFTDVPYGSTFWVWVERLAGREVMAGYPCGIDPNEPCDGQNRPYFRPNAGATRGQLTKIVSNAAGFNDTIPPTQYTFTDVPPSNTFWVFVERLLLNRPNVMGGYACGGAGEPCDTDNRPYFRPNNPLTRGQTSKIVANTFFPGCNPPRP